MPKSAMTSVNAMFGTLWSRMLTLGLVRTALTDGRLRHASEVKKEACKKNLYGEACEKATATYMDLTRPPGAGRHWTCVHSAVVNYCQVNGKAPTQEADSKPVRKVKQWQPYGSLMNR